MQRPTLAVALALTVASAVFVAGARADPRPSPHRGFSAEPIATPALMAAVTGALREILKPDTSQQTVKVSIAQAYADAEYQPIWFNTRTGLARLNGLRKALREATSEGLDPRRYALDAAATSFTGSDPRQWAELDLRASQEYLRYVQDLQGTHPDSTAVRPVGAILPQPVDNTLMLGRAVRATDISAHLEDIAPRTAIYLSMKKALVRYRALRDAGGWPMVPRGKALEPGDVSPRVPLLRQRLFATGDLVDSSLESEIYSEDLRTAVQRFQSRHGLSDDGVIGKRTMRALSMPVEQRVQQIVANMERARWLPADMGGRHVLVNVPGFDLEIVENQAPVASMAIIVGRRMRRSPIVSGELTRLEINPNWNVPESIARKDLLPKLREDPYHLFDAGLRLFDKDSREELTRDEIDWEEVAANGTLPFRMRQDPGPQNALGRVKFMFQNDFAVYLHDTPSRRLFAKPERAFSSGCIRVERPLELAEYLLLDKPGWERYTIDEVVESGDRTSVQLPAPVPVHLIYRTAWMGANGQVQFRHDLYGRDEFIANKLLAKRASAAANDV